MYKSHLHPTCTIRIYHMKNCPWNLKLQVIHIADQITNWANYKKHILWCQLVTSLFLIWHDSRCCLCSTWVGNQIQYISLKYHILPYWFIWDWRSLNECDFDSIANKRQYIKNISCNILEDTYMFWTVVRVRSPEGTLQRNLFWNVITGSLINDLESKNNTTTLKNISSNVLNTFDFTNTTIFQ